ncbi:MAG: PDZ domain-containing protein [Aureispira sp.]
MKILNIILLIGLFLGSSLGLLAQNSHYAYTYNKARYAKLGVSLEKDETGVLIKSVSDKSAAQFAGLQTGDRLVAFNNVKVWSSQQLIAMIKDYEGGETIRIDYQRNGQVVSTNATLQTKINKRARAYDNFKNPCEEVEKMTNRPFLGVYLESTHDDTPTGVRINSIIKNTGAAASELQAEDRIIGLDGKTIKNSQAVHNHIQKTKKPNDPMTIEVLRDNKRVTLTAIVGSWADRKEVQKRLAQKQEACEMYSNPASACAALQEMEGNPFLGVYMQNVTSQNGGGALVMSVIEGTQAAQSSLKAGDKIIRFNDVVVKSHSDASEMIQNTRPNDPVRLEVVRGDQVLQVDVVMGSLTNRPSNSQQVAALEEVCALNDNTAEEPAPTAPKEDQKPSISLSTAATTLTLFPNPSTNYVNVIYEGQEGALAVSVVSLDGKRMYDKEVPEFNGVYNDQISLKNFPAGVYIVYITQGNNRTSEQLVIE